MMLPNILDLNDILDDIKEIHIGYEIRERVNKATYITVQLFLIEGNSSEININ